MLGFIFCFYQPEMIGFKTVSRLIYRILSESVAIFATSVCCLVTIFIRDHV